MILIICGVSGTGKSTIGSQLAKKLELPFYDGDDFHSESNMQKMLNGSPLNDLDRQPWLESLAKHIASWEIDGGAVLACSALKETYRTILASQANSNITWVMLDGTRDLLIKRLDSRSGHFFDSTLLDSQLNTLELPDYGWLVDIKDTPATIVDTISIRLQELKLPN
ncbi:gluconokinase [uncultured Paraglaciecola sp.]|uniref:gluconokinase n=1 Tax=uncultured Paraglaciecola sp. TaxID=1765024 RepID=UPI002591C0FD|nr:gluconokinase [uncultured Paraglaciecola sp.]